jgi:hypothetical protein
VAAQMELCPSLPIKRKTRAEIVTARIKEANQLAGLQVERATVNREPKTVEADLEPILLLLAATIRRTFIAVR